MEEKKDIGTFFKDKLKDGEKSPDKRLWDRISTSLDKEKPVQKSKLQYWLIGLGIPIFLGLALLFIPSEQVEKNPKIPIENNPTELPFSSIEKPSDTKEERVSAIDSLENIEISTKDPIERTTSLEDSKKKKNQNTKEITPENKIKNSSTESSNADETFTVSKKYYYYNSEDGVEWSTTDKNKIDSLLTNETRILDSTTIRKKDSLTEQYMPK